ncbi:MAG: ABC transporter ATP-binding protein [Oscillospiraceae bacterium]
MSIDKNENTESEILRLENINFCYETGEIALCNVSLTIAKGERIAVIGNNGAGKSTFFLCCNGILKQDSGDIFYHGKKLSQSRKDLFLLRKNVGLVLQDPDNQMIASTVESEISFGPMNLGFTDDEVLERVDDAISEMKLTSLRCRPPHYLSGGEKKRVCIADIIAMRPEIVLLDEPASSLDPQNAASLEQTIIELGNAGITVAVSTHDVDFAWRWADRIIVFSDAQIVADTSPDMVFADIELLKTAGLRKPEIYELTEIAYKTANKNPPKRFPKTKEEFAMAIGGIL